MSEVYPKIETLFDRDPKTFKVLEDKIRFPEFLMVQNWHITEKIDGTNVRVSYRINWEPTGQYLSPTQPVVRYAGRIVDIYGRTENAQMPTFLMNYLQRTFTLEKFQAAFPDLKPEISVILYGEGYGPKIQSGGKYRKDVSCRLFDVKVGQWWLEPDNIESVAQKMGVKTVPTLDDVTIQTAVHLVKSNPFSQVALAEGGHSDARMEGIVARTVPLLLRRNGERLMWKLKRKDFP